MERLTVIWLSSVGDLLVNLSAGWFGAALILPVTVRRAKLKVWLLLLNVVFGILALLSAVVVRSLV